LAARDRLFGGPRIVFPEAAVLLFDQRRNVTPTVSLLSRRPIDELAEPSRGESGAVRRLLTELMDIGARRQCSCLITK
jgi:hypothetical protein